MVSSWKITVSVDKRAIFECVHEMCVCLGRTEREGEGGEREGDRGQSAIMAYASNYLFINKLHRFPMNIELAELVNVCLCTPLYSSFDSRHALSLSLSLGSSLSA